MKRRRPPIGPDAPLDAGAEEARRFPFESNPQPMWVYDLETLAFLEVNDAAVRRYGWSRAEMLAMTIRDIRPPSEVPRLLEWLGADAPTFSESGVWTHRTRSGAELLVEIVSRTVTWGGRRAKMVLALDVTERERGAAALRESEARFRELVEDLNDVLFEMDERGRLSYLSPAIETILGYRPEELVGRDYLEIVAPADRVMVADFVTRAVTGGGAVPLEYRVVARNGRVRWARSFARPIERDGRIVGLRGVAADITDLRDTESKLIAAREQLLQAQKMEAIGRLAGGIAHDFNNLLTVIQGYAELVQRDLPPAGEPHAAIGQILRAAERAAELTRQLLAFGRRQVLRPTLTDLNRIVEDVERMLRRVLGEDVEIAIRLAPHLASVHLDAGQMQQVLLNLAVNARDAMPEGGRLTLATAETTLEAAEAAAVGLAPGSYVELRVSDTGTGIAPEIRDLIFEPFFTTKETGKGTGLGLASVYGIVRQSGGGIAVASHVGRGSVFSIYLPPAPALAGGEPDETPASAPAPRQGGGTVLVVESDAAVRRIVRRTLEGAGLRVVEATTGAEALELALRSAERVDLIFSGLAVPGTTGLELVRRLIERWPEARVLLASGYAAESAAVGGAGSGFPFLEKPFTSRRLLEKVREALEGGG